MSNQTPCLLLLKSTEEAKVLNHRTSIHTMTEMTSYTERRLETINHKNPKKKHKKDYMYRQSCKCQHFAAVLCWEQFSGS